MDDDDVDPSVVTRASLLSGGDFTPEAISGKSDDHLVSALKYAVYDINSNGAIKVLAYTNANGEDYYYGVVSGNRYHDADFSGTNDWGVKFTDDSVFELKKTESGNTKCPELVSDDALLIYKQSGEKIEVVGQIAKKGATGSNTTPDESEAELVNTYKEVTGVTDGLITIEITAAVEADEENGIEAAAAVTKNVMTDSSTLVYVIDGTTGKFVEGSLSDVAKGSYVIIPVIDDDGYADLVVIDEYNH
jgi:hypothetical protein